MCMIAHHTNNRPSCHSVAFFVKDRRGKYLYDEQSFCKQIQAPPENLNHMQKV